MAEENQIPLDELLFGPKADSQSKREPSLAEVISDCFRNGRARSRQDQAAQRSTLPHPAGEPKK
jgi:hypothetical protein